MSDAELYMLSSDIDKWNEDIDLFDGCDESLLEDEE